jgi:hypothetical protein
VVIAAMIATPVISATASTGPEFGAMHQVPRHILGQNLNGVALVANRDLGRRTNAGPEFGAMRQVPRHILGRHLNGVPLVANCDFGRGTNRATTVFGILRRVRKENRLIIRQRIGGRFFV